MNNNVQAYIAVVSFPTSIEELRDLTDNDYIENKNFLLNFYSAGINADIITCA